MSMTVRSRPFGVGFLSWLIILTGLAEIVAGIVLLATRNSDEVHAVLRDIPNASVTTIAIVGIVLGVIDLIVASGLRNGAGWARFLVGLVAVVRVAALAWSVIAHHGYHWYQAVLPAAVYLLVLGYLYADEDAKAFFAPA